MEERQLIYALERRIMRLEQKVEELLADQKELVAQYADDSAPNIPKKRNEKNLGGPQSH